MKTKRVGTISMAIVLIGFGLTLLIGQFSKISALELAIKIWPLILIILGGEILYIIYTKKKGNQDIIIKYDIFSIFIVTTVLIVNIGIYSLMEIGLIDYFKIVVANETRMYEEYMIEN